MDLEKKKSLYGFLFILPWVIGFGTIFLRSLISSSAIPSAICGSLPAN